MTPRPFARALALLSGACGPAAGHPADLPSLPAPPRASTAAPPIDPIRAALAAPDRPAGHRARDDRLRAAELFHFFGLAPGQRVAELAVRSGWAAHVAARVVGPSGHVFAQAVANVPPPGPTWLLCEQRPFDEPFPPGAAPFDAVLLIEGYHDLVWLGVDRPRLLERVLAAMAPGGVFGVVDVAAGLGRGLEDATALHRIEEATVVLEAESAGFRLAKRSDLLAEPSDARDFDASPAAARGRPVHRFVLRFERR